MEKNIGTIDRIIRVALALGLGIFGVTQISTGLWWIGLFGLVPLGTALISFCPVYLPFGIKTIKVQKLKT